MQITLNEKHITIAAGTTLHQLRDEHKPAADIVILNGHPVRDDAAIADGDHVVLIKRGETPSAEEMEALLMARHTPGVHERLKTTTVGIAGVGGLGSAIAVALARSGVGRLILADFDIVEPSNLNRQQYFVDQLGLPKVDALKANLRRINPCVQAAAFFGRLDADNLPQVFAGVRFESLMEDGLRENHTDQTAQRCHEQGEPKGAPQTPSAANRSLGRRWGREAAHPSMVARSAQMR